MDYALPNHIHTCATEAGVVVLDARRGKYSLVPGDRARTLEGVVRGWPALVPPSVIPANRSGPSSSLLDSLVRGGVIAPRFECGSLDERHERAPAIVATEALLDALNAREIPKFSWRRVITFFLSVAYASVVLKHRPFYKLLNNLRMRKERGARLATEPTITEIRDCVRVFSWLRPFAYAQSDACLFDSVALTDFLYREDVFVEFVVGVRVQPFGAHSWVQFQGFALNDIPEYLGAYTPILSV
jgi:hypothetical protein